MRSRNLCSCGIFLLAFALWPEAGGATARGPAATQLRWDFSPALATPGQCRVYAAIGADAAGKELWRTPVPEWMKGKTCSCQEARATPLQAPVTLGIGTMQNPRWPALLALQSGGVLALDSRSGKVLLDHAPAPGQQPVPIERGTFTVSGKPACMGIVRQGMTMTQCGEEAREMLYLVDGRALLIGLYPVRIVAEGAWDGKPAEEGPGRMELRIPLGKSELTVRGTMRPH